MDQILVVGAALAGSRAAETLRKEGFGGRVVLVGAEPHLPYDRPPLSKEVLAGEAEPDSVVLHPAEHWADLDVELRLGAPATSLDTDGRTVHVDGTSLPYDGLIIATGARPRRLPFGHDLSGVHVLRGLDDAVAIRAALAAHPRVVVIGAGFIGAEAASSARSAGCEVTVVEALSAPLVRGLGHEIGAACGVLHTDHGTDLRCGVEVSDITGDGRVEAVHLGDGTVLDAGLVIVGIGVTPDLAWLEGSGLAIDDGIVCDEHLATGAPGVYAAGDCVRWPNPALGGADIRVEHWTNAAEQGAQAARNLLAGPDGQQPFSSIPFVWSDQYGSRIQIAGHPTEDDDAEMLLGSIDDREFLAAYRRDEALVGVAALDMIRPFVKFRLLLQRGGSWDEGVELAGSLA